MELKRKVVIIGGCIAAKEAAGAIRDNDKSCIITIISSEDYLPYYRPMLSRAIGQELTKTRLYLAPESWYKERNIDLVLSTEISQVLPDQNSVVATNGDTYDYTHLIIATGATNFIPLTNATGMEGVLSIRDYNDVIKLRALLPRVKTAVVVGGGLLGIEAAWELQQQNIQVKLIEYAPYVLPKQLDRDSANFLSEHLQERGVGLVCSSATQNVLGTDTVTGVQCASGEVHPCDLLLFSTGAIPNIGVVKDTRIATDRGIIVDQHMRTNIPNIYAAGDVAQNEYGTSGIWVPAMEMGKVAGSNVAGKEMVYAPAFTSTMLTAFDTKVFSIGKISDDPSVMTETIADPKKRFFKKLFAHDGMLIGAILIGDISQGTRLAKQLGVISLEDAKELIE